MTGSQVPCGLAPLATPAHTCPAPQLHWKRSYCSSTSTILRDLWHPTLFAALASGPRCPWTHNVATPAPPSAALAFAPLPRTTMVPPGPPPGPSSSRYPPLPASRTQTGAGVLAVHLQLRWRCGGKDILVLGVSLWQWAVHLFNCPTREHSPCPKPVPPSLSGLSEWHHHPPGGPRPSPVCGPGLFPPLPRDIPSDPGSLNASFLLLELYVKHPAVVTVTVSLDIHSSLLTPNASLLHSLYSSQGATVNCPSDPVAICLQC